MIQIHNNIDEHIEVTFYHGDDVIGTCHNALAFLDALCQIKEQGDNHYSISTKATLPNGDIRTVKFNIDERGRLSPAIHKHVTLWNDILTTQLLYLYGFKTNFYYSNQN